VLAAHDCYGGSWRLFDALARKQHFHLRLVDMTDAAAVDGKFVSAFVRAEKPR